MELTHVVHLSGGIASWVAGMRIAEREGRDHHRFVCVFADTLMEDEDLYRFLIEGAAAIYEVSRPKISEVLAQAAKIPPIESGDLEGRKLVIRRLIPHVRRVLPGLDWIVEGRTPWEVYNDVRFLGNTRIDPCSKELKRQLIHRHCKEWFDPTTTVHHFGLDWTEPKRIADLDRIMSLKGIDCEFPLTFPRETKEQYLQRARDLGIDPPRLYQWGFPHNNCGGFCCKAGQSSMKLLLINLPKRYAYHEQKEQEIRGELGDVAVMRDRKGGTSRPLTMQEFRERFEANGECDEQDKGACSCFGRSGDAVPD